MTTNLAFEKRPALFGDAMLATAMVDRMANKATVIEIIGESYRVRQTKRWMEGNGTDTDSKRATLSRKSGGEKERLSGQWKANRRKESETEKGRWVNSQLPGRVKFHLPKAQRLSKGDKTPFELA